MLKDTKPKFQDAFEEVEPGRGNSAGSDLFNVDWIYRDAVVVLVVLVGLFLSGVMGWIISPTWLGVLTGIMCYALGYHAVWLAKKGLGR